MSEILNRADILGQTALAVEWVEVPEWGGRTVGVREMTGTDRDNWEASLNYVEGEEVKQDLQNFRAKLLVRCLVGEDLKPIFSAADVDALGKLSARALDRLARVAKRINGIGEKSLEQAEKNSASGPAGDSISA